MYINNIQKAYLVLAIIWIIIIIIFQLYNTDIIGIIIILIPFIIFGINAYNSNESDVPDDNMSSYSSINIGLILLLPILAYLDKNFRETASERIRFISLIVLSLTLYLLIYITVWVPPRYLGLVYRINAALITMSVSLTIYVLYLYYTHRKYRESEVEKNINIEYEKMALII